MLTDDRKPLHTCLISLAEIAEGIYNNPQAAQWIDRRIQAHCARHTREHLRRCRTAREQCKTSDAQFVWKSSATKVWRPFEFRRLGLAQSCQILVALVAAANPEDAPDPFGSILIPIDIDTELESICHGKGVEQFDKVMASRPDLGRRFRRRFQASIGSELFHGLVESFLHDPERKAVKVRQAIECVQRMLPPELQGYPFSEVSPAAVRKVIAKVLRKFERPYTDRVHDEPINDPPAGSSLNPNRSKAIVRAARQHYASSYPYVRGATIDDLLRAVRAFRTPDGRSLGTLRREIIQCQLQIMEDDGKVSFNDRVYRLIMKGPLRSKKTTGKQITKRRRAHRGLTDRERQAITLFDNLGNVSEVATVMEISRQRVTVLVNNARNKLRVATRPGVSVKAQSLPTGNRGEPLIEDRE